MGNSDYLSPLSPPWNMLKFPSATMAWSIDLVSQMFLHSRIYFFTMNAMRNLHHHISAHLIDLKWPISQKNDVNGKIVLHLVSIYRYCLLISNSFFGNTCVLVKCMCPRVRFACLSKTQKTSKWKFRRENMRAWLCLKHQFSLAVVEA